MFISCDICNYDSGDYDNPQLLMDKINIDGGVMEMSYDNSGKPKGWNITCPNCLNSEGIHMD